MGRNATMSRSDHHIRVSLVIYDSMNSKTKSDKNALHVTQGDEVSDTKPQEILYTKLFQFGMC